MAGGAPEAAARPPALLLVTSPSGDHAEALLRPLPFHIGRLGENHLALRDNRISRRHARIVAEGEGYVIEDLGSSHGLYVNGRRVERHRLRHGDQIGFGFEDTYRLTFLLGGAGVQGLLEQTEPGSGLARLRAMLEVARALQASLSTDEVLAAVVEAALAITGCPRGFLLLEEGGELAVRVARDRSGPLPGAEPRLSRAQLRQALAGRSALLTISRQAVAGGIALPLVRIRTGAAQQTTALSPGEDTVGMLYMESDQPVELPAGSGELLATLALEASTVLENARLLEEGWARQRMEEELKIARRIQENLLPGELPACEWLRAAGASLPSREVGGDYYDLRPVSPDCWALAMADVSGKGVGAALLAALLQGMLVAAPYARLPVEEVMGRLNRFLLERTRGEQYATIFYGLLESSGRLRWVNAGHPPALLMGRGGVRRLPAGALPLGLLEEACYSVQEVRLEPGDRLVLYTDGLTDARSPAGEFFSLARLERAAAARAEAPAAELHRALLEAVEQFTQASEQADDITLLVVEYGEGGGTRGRG